MKIGTKSVLFGAHAFWLHPWFVAWAWWKLYGFPWNLLLWLAFFVHDLGYLGKPNMDGPEGETHPVLGARIMSVFGQSWMEFCLFHSRFYAKRAEMPYSRLCVADKLAIVLTPAWLYLPMTKLTGEVYEYMGREKHQMEVGASVTPEEWFGKVKDYMLGWIEEHKDGRADTWTPNTDERIPADGKHGSAGVWK